MVRARARGSVRWATAKLKADFFLADPERIVTIWLFRDRDRYEQAAPTEIQNPISTVESVSASSAANVRT